MQFSQQNSNDIINAFKARGMTNQFFIAGVLGTVAKETGVVPVREKGYSHTNNSRIRMFLGSRLGNIDDAALNILKTNDQAFFDKVYLNPSSGGTYGNTNPGDGYSYRGGGYNGLTFKDNYRAVGNAIGVDLVSHPEKINESDTAAKALAEYYHQHLTPAYLSSVGVTSLNEIKDIQTGTKLAAEITAGSTHLDHSAALTEGLTRALAFAPLFFPFIVSPQDSDKKKLIKITVFVVFAVIVIVVVFLIIKK